MSSRITGSDRSRLKKDSNTVSPLKQLGSVSVLMGESLN